MMDNWKCKIVFRPDMIAHAVYMFKDMGGDTDYLKGDMSRVTVPKYTTPKDDPYFALLDDDMIHALGLAINDAGYQAPNEHLIEGKLTATEKHLEDMRSLVFKNRPAPNPKQEK